MMIECRRMLIDNHQGWKTLEEREGEARKEEEKLDRLSRAGAKKATLLEKKRKEKSR